jgi:hypothetical protein
LPSLADIFFRPGTINPPGCEISFFSDELRCYFFIQFVNQECERAVCRMGRARGQKMNFIRLMAFGAAASNKASKEAREKAW